MLVAVIPALSLTPRQYEIVLLAMDGMTNRSIATALDLSRQAVTYHLGKAFERLGITGRTELAVKLWWEIEGKYR